MNWKKQYKNLLLLIGIFLLAYFLPVENTTFKNALIDAFKLARWYAREHVLLCLIPAFFIAGVISVFISKGAVLKYLGARAKKWVSYLVASVSGSILAVCSCTVLPLFAGIYTQGAGLGPAIAFLYSGPAINILAIILTARILGPQLGIARAVGAIIFSVVVGIIMHLLYRQEEKERAEANLHVPDSRDLPAGKTALHFVALLGILIFATWGGGGGDSAFWNFIYNNKWYLTGFFSLILSFTMVKLLKIKTHKVAIGILIVLGTAFLSSSPLFPFAAGIFVLGFLTSTKEGLAEDWFEASYDFALQILPLLGAGVLVAGFLLGMPGEEGGIIPSSWIASLVGGNSILANFFAAISGAFMYFATLTEVPIVQGLLAKGMGDGPALALLLAGPAVSLPNMLVIRSVLGTRKTISYVIIVVVLSTFAGFLYGAII